MIDLISSFERMYFSDAHYTPDDEEPLMNEPHGYLTGDDVKYFPKE